MARPLPEDEGTVIDPHAMERARASVIRAEGSISSVTRLRAQATRRITRKQDGSSYLAAGMLLAAAVIVLFFGPPELPARTAPTAPDPAPAVAPAAPGPVPGMPRILPRGGPTKSEPRAKAAPAKAPIAGNPASVAPAPAPAARPAAPAPSPLDKLLAKATSTADLSAVDAAAARLKRTEGEAPAEASGPRGSGSASTVGGDWTSTKKGSAPDVSLSDRNAHVVTSSERRRERAQISQDTLKKVLAGLDSQVRLCWEKASGSGRSGRVAAELTIASSGKVTAADTSGSTLKNNGVRSCIERVLTARAKFPAISGTATVEYYWDFSAD